MNENIITHERWLGVSTPSSGLKKVEGKAGNFPKKELGIFIFNEFFQICESSLAPDCVRGGEDFPY